MADYLTAQGYDVVTAFIGTQARHALQICRPHLMILDIGLPDEDGLGIVRYVREQLDIAIVIVSGANDPIDRIIGFEIGSDDCLSKTFDIELKVRVKDVLRRYRQHSSSPSAEHTGRRVRLGGAEFDLDVRLLINLERREIPLTATEYGLLKLFVERPRRPLSRD